VDRELLDTLVGQQAGDQQDLPAPARPHVLRNTEVTAVRLTTYSCSITSRVERASVIEPEAAMVCLEPNTRAPSGIHASTGVESRWGLEPLKSASSAFGTGVRVDSPAAVIWLLAGSNH
jgi:hypothetical protein